VLESQGPPERVKFLSIPNSATAARTMRPLNATRRPLLKRSRPTTPAYPGTAEARTTPIKSIIRWNAMARSPCQQTGGGVGGHHSTFRQQRDLNSPIQPLFSKAGAKTEYSVRFHYFQCPRLARLSPDVVAKGVSMNHAWKTFAPNLRPTWQTRCGLSQLTRTPA